MTITAPMPPVHEVAALANQFEAAIMAHPEFDRFTRSTKMYVDCWATYTGYPTIPSWDQDTDKEPLIVEALRVLALKAAVWQLTDGDEQRSELLVSLPVDEMVHAILAQTNLVNKFTADLGIAFVHMTDTEVFGWEPGDSTSQCYEAAWGQGSMPSRYWIGHEETKRRLKILEELHEQAGIHKNGRSHDITFEVVAA